MEGTRSPPPPRLSSSCGAPSGRRKYSRNVRPLHAWLAGSALALAAGGLAGCGSGSAAPTIPTITAAKVTQLADFQPAGKIVPGRPTTLSFRIQQPDGSTLTAFKTGPGPHTGVHVIVVSKSLDSIDHQHPPHPDGRISEKIVFPTPGRYRVVVDVYPKNPQPLPNFQLFHWLTVPGKAPVVKLPPFQATQKVGGYTVAMQGKPALSAIQAGFLNLDVKDANGKPVTFEPWFGALAHAIFFREGTLDYFHTHVCAPGASACAKLLGATKITGTATPGKMRVGVLVPVGGTWRLFLQFRPKGGKVLTVPFTLPVSG